MIRFQFVLGAGLSSQAIAWFSAGHFSHVDAVLPDGTLLGARSDQVGVDKFNQPISAGVRIRQPDYEKWKERVVMTLPNGKPAQEKAWIDFLTKQIGKPYDSTAIWGFAAGRDWRETDSWFCSELGSASIEAAKVVPQLYSPANKITPSALALTLSALGAKIT